jgi:thiamine-phosphate pyrophosphorylase
VRDLTATTGALFVVNDHVDIAMISGADGVHLGPDDLSVESARRIAGEELLIGASASSPAAASAAVAQGADYLGSGPAFATPLKTEKKVIGPDGVAAIVGAIAIGGIDASNLSQLTSRGLKRACVIRAVGDAPDPESATRHLRAMLDS